MPGTGVICSEISPTTILACHRSENEIMALQVCAGMLHSWMSNERITGFNIDEVSAS